MATRGRKRKKEADKVKIMQAYLTQREQEKIKKHFGTLTKAARERLLPECA
jgi:hypothetical protein